MKTWKPYERHACGDCGTREGALHVLGCDQERCPFCGGQLVSCDCVYTLLDIRDEDCYTHETEYLPPAVYCEGLSETDAARWAAMLAARGRVPFIDYPTLCGYCGQAWPAMFLVPDEVWKQYIQRDARRLQLCERCWAWIVAAINQTKPSARDGQIKRLTP